MGKPFIFSTTKNILAELGSSRTKLGGIVKQLGAKRVLVVTDPGIQKLGLLTPAVQHLKADGVGVEIYDGVKEDPPESVVFEATDMAKRVKAEAVIGFGGGSSMDTAKLAAALAVSSQPLSTMYGVGQMAPETKRLPLIQIPTTAGTGSEVTPVTIVTTGEAEKKGVVDPLLLPDWAVLDGELTLSVPKHVTSATGIDAMVHAIEAYTGKLKKNPMADMLAVEALRLLGKNIRTVCDSPDNAEARSDMLLGACLAGMAFANSPVAAVHALAYPIGSHFHVPHGLSNSLMLPHVIRFNAQNPLTHQQYLEIAHLVLDQPSPLRSCDDFSNQIAQLSVDLDMKTTLREVGIAEKDLRMLASEAMKQQRLLQNNPIEVAEQNAFDLYAAAL